MSLVTSQEKDVDAVKVDDDAGVAREQVYRLARSRAGFASNVTRKFGLLMESIGKKCTLPVLNMKYDELEVAFEHYKEAHGKYEELAQNIEPEKLEKARHQFKDVEALLLNAERELDEYVDYAELDDAGDEIKPKDSVSQLGSSASTTVSQMLAKAAAKSAGLKVKFEHSKQQSELEYEQMCLNWRKQEAELQAEIAAAAAEEDVLCKHASHVTPSGTTRANQKHIVDPVFNQTKHSNLNHMAAPWHPQFQPQFQSTHMNPSNLPWPAPEHSNQDMTSTSNIIIQRQMLDMMNLPKSTMMTFDGEPMNFYTFMSTFDNCVGNTAVDDGAKLNRLFEYCRGKAAYVIKPCALMNPTEGYRKARRLLKDRFGNEFRIAESWIKKVTDGPMIKPNDGEGIQDLADDVRGCLETLRAMGKHTEIDSRIRMVKIVERLPYYLLGRWRKVAVSTLDSTGDYPNFENLASFLDKAARECNDPVFGSISSPEKKQDYTQKKQRPVIHKSFSVQTVSDRPSEKYEKVTMFNPNKCYHCNGEHVLVDCPDFVRMNPQDKLQMLKGKSICFNCLSGRRHRARWCRKQSDCSCGEKHSKLVHAALVDKTKEKSSSSNNTHGSSYEKTNSKSPRKVQAKSCASAITADPIALPIVAVMVKGAQEQKIRTYALLDPGSNRCFCSLDLLNELGIKGIQSKLSLETLTSGQDTDATEVSLEVSGVDKHSRNVLLPKVYAVKSFPSLRNSLPRAEDFSKWKHLKGLQVPNGEQDVTILIGQDVPHAIIPLEVRSGEHSEPYAVRTLLGWTVNGPLGDECTAEEATCNFIQATDVMLDKQVENFWKIDTGHSLVDDQPQLSLDDQKVLGVWEESIKVDNGRFQLDIPFRSSPPGLQGNKVMAEARLRSLGRRLGRSPELHKKYTMCMNNLIAEGYAERVSGEGIPGWTWYLPHHNVVNKRKPDKFRIVFDCAAQHAGISLNKSVHQGPDLMNRLLGVLLRFREHSVAVMGDIEAMYHQVKVSPRHRDVLRFLWWENGDVTRPPDVYRMTVHLFGGIWSPSCASFALRHTAEDYCDDFDSHVLTVLKNDFYVDDCLTSVNSESEAIHLVSELRRLLSLRGFRLTKWLSNKRKVMETIPESELASQVRSIDLQDSSLPVERALGVSWDAEDDTLGLRITVLEPALTRRKLLSIICSLYDPLGFLCPFILPAKMIFQAECRRGKGWDEKLEEENIQKWLKWMSDLPKLRTFKISRCVIPEDMGCIDDIQLHHFCDASQDAYGAVSYLRIQGMDGSVYISFVMGKSRLAPIRQMTIPRLELSGAVLAVRMNGILQREMRLSVSKTYFWTDSTIVLQYIHSRTKRFQTFVANRLTIIHDGTSPGDWRHIPTWLNPADDVSRGLNAADVQQWIEGPRFLQEAEEAWPQTVGILDLPADHCEVKREANVCTTVVDNDDPVNRILLRFSCWHRLCKAVAWFLRFKTWLRKNKTILRGHLTVEEIVEAETAIIKALQKKFYSSELCALTSEKTVSKGSCIYNLEPFLDKKGLIRVGGRLKSAPVAYNAKYPAVISKDHHVSEVIVRHCHSVLGGHCGREHVMSLIRERFWIPRVRSLIKKILSRCVVCRRISGKARPQRMADLPPERVTPGNPPFTHVGIDCFGPFFVKRGRSKEKRYGCIFTCMAIRAIHIEKLNTLETDSFINGLVRFISRRGVPAKIRSDNGTNFVGAEREIGDALKHWNNNPKLRDVLLLKKIEWEFNPPAASHMGGVWERQIRSVRKILNGILSKEVLDDERLDTLFCEVESVINDRPLTHLSGSPCDAEALTPNHLLLLRSGSTPLKPDCTKAGAYRRRWKHVQVLADRFWQRWLKEYLPLLQLRQKWIQPTRNFAENDIVLMVDENLPRKAWSLGRIVKTFPGKDGLVRAVELRTSHGSLVRPVSKLCLLESIDVSDVDGSSE